MDSPNGFENVVVHFAIRPARAWDNVHQHCSMVLPFRRADDIARWSSRYALPRGEAVPLHQVARLATLWYGSHANPDWHKWTIAEAQAIFQNAGLTSPFWSLENKDGRFSAGRPCSLFFCNDPLYPAALSPLCILSSHRPWTARIPRSPGPAMRRTEAAILTIRSGTPRRSRLLVQLCGYVAAILLPWIGVTFTIRTPALHGTPLALSFVFVAGIRPLQQSRPRPPLGRFHRTSSSIILPLPTAAPCSPSSPQSLLYTAVILAIGFLIAFLCDRQRVVSSSLRAALASLRGPHRFSYGSPAGQ